MKTRHQAAPLLLALALLLPAAIAPATTTGWVCPECDRHVLEVRFDPASSSLRGTDRLTTRWTKSLRFQLHDGLSFSATCSGRKLVEAPLRTRPLKGFVPPDADAAASAWHELRIPRECADEEGNVTIDFQIDGTIHDPVEQEPSLHFVTGDRTSGIISPDGVFLAGGTFWYPQTGRPEIHDLTADVPAGWSVVSQGSRVDALAPAPDGGVRGPAPDGAVRGPAPDGLVRQRYASSVPADGLALSAGPYVVTKRQHGDVEIATFLLEGEKDQADLFLDAAEIEIDRLAAVLGPYPYSKFDVVENFFTTGYGFPAYTLLGKDVIRMGPRALRPGYLDHEIAHVWLGNFVNVDVSTGNWCEGLVSYLTNYLGAARAGEAEALSARRRVSQRYSVDVPAAKDFAPRAFVTKTDDASSSIGYGKVSMVFHVLRRELGDEAFWKGLAGFVSAKGGSRATWKDVESAFEKASGRDLAAFFEQWIGRASLPELSLEGVVQDGPRVRGVVVQAGDPWRLELDLELLYADGATERVRVAANAARTPFDVPAARRVARVTLDPAFDVPRRLRPDDMPASLARTLAGDGRPPLVVYPDPKGSHVQEEAPLIERAELFKPLAELLAPTGATLMASKDVADSDVRASSLLLLGHPDENRIVQRYVEAVEAATQVDLSRPGSFRAGDRRWRGDDDAVLVSIPHPDRPGATITIFAPNGRGALDEGRKLFYYGWDSWAALQHGLAKQRGSDWPLDVATSARLSDADADTSAAGRMLATVRQLADPRLEGRDAGSRGAREAGVIATTAMLSAGLEPAGLRGFSDPFTFNLLDLPQQPVLAVPAADGRQRYVPILPAHRWIPLPQDFTTTEGSTQGIVPERAPMIVRLDRGLVHVGSTPSLSFAGLDLRGSLGVILDGAAGKTPRSPEDEARRLQGWADEARLHGALGLLVVRPSADGLAPRALAAFASQAPPSMSERREKTRAEGGQRALERAAAGERARSADLPYASDLPVFFGGDELRDALEAAGGFVRGKRTWDGAGLDARFNMIAERLGDANVVGVVGGDDIMAPAILVQAHLDAVGELADGIAASGAVDDASGVAVLLEVARRLSAKPSRVSVFFACTAAEEWGLQGSRHLADRWTSDGPRIAAVVNVDSVGQAGKPLHVVGRSQFPELAAIVESAAGSHGFEIGKDIDRYAHHWGSDHWPWAAKNVPAIDVFQADYAVLNSGRDTIDLLDGPTLERLADALEQAVRKIAGE